MTSVPKRNFADWLTSLQESISDYRYYVDFKKIYRLVDAIRVELNILNALIGSKNIEDDFEHIVTKYPETLKCIPLLLAVRAREILVLNEQGLVRYQFDNLTNPISEYKEFMRETGLFDLIANHIINNLVDYALGVETGLDSNGRKNRGGHLMEDLVEKFIKQAGFISNETYFKEMSTRAIETRWGLDLSSVSNAGRSAKRFDFVVKTESTVYAIEANFYTGGGSKLNETARSYKNIALEAQDIPGFTFVWFTDGIGWKSARHNLEETFDVLPHLYNIADMRNGIMTSVFK